MQRGERSMSRRRHDVSEERRDHRCVSRGRGSVDMCVHWTYIKKMARQAASRSETARARGKRLGFRVDAQTKQLVEHAAELESRSLTDFCVSVLADAARLAVEKHESLVLSPADRATFFDALVHPPAPSARLRRAVQNERARV